MLNNVSFEGDRLSVGGIKVKEKKIGILMLLQLIFALLVILMGIYGKVTENYNLLPLMLILLSVIILIAGLREYKRTKSLLWGIVYLCISLFILISVIEAIVVNWIDVIFNQRALSLNREEDSVRNTVNKQKLNVWSFSGGWLICKTSQGLNQSILPSR